MGAIIGATIGAVLVGVIICAIVAWCLLLRRRRRRRDSVPHLVAFGSSDGMRDDDVERGVGRADIQSPLAAQAADSANRLSRSYPDLDLDLDLNEKERLSQLFAFPSESLQHHRASATEASSVERSSVVPAPSSVVGGTRDSATWAVASDTHTPPGAPPPKSDSLSTPISTLGLGSVVATPQDASGALEQSLNDADLNRIAAAVSKMLSSDPEAARTYLVTIRGEERAAQDGADVECREAARVPPLPYGL